MYAGRDGFQIRCLAGVPEFSDKEEHRRDAYNTLDSATFVPQEAVAVSQFEYGRI